MTVGTIFPTLHTQQDWPLRRFHSLPGALDSWTLITTGSWTYAWRTGTSTHQWINGTGAQPGLNGHSFSAISMVISFRRFRLRQEAAWPTWSPQEAPRSGT